MWTKEHRARQLAFEQRRRYPTNLTDDAGKRLKGRKRHLAVDTND